MSPLLSTALMHGPPRALSPDHDPFVAKDIRHKVDLDPEALAMQKNWWGEIWDNQ